MEFTKNYSDDLLMGNRNEQTGAAQSAASTDFDLASFDTIDSAQPSGKQESPVRQQRKSSDRSTAPTSSASLAAPDLTAVKNLLLSTYSQIAPVVLWKKPIETGVYFGIGLVLMVALSIYSIISVVAYGALAAIATSALMRVYKALMKAIGRPTETPFDHVWSKALGMDVTFSPERLHELVNSSHQNLNSSAIYFKQVLLVENIFATFKFSLFLYSLTYIGALFNGITLIHIAFLSLFIVPKVYESNKANIDQYLNLATRQASSLFSSVTSKVSTLAFGTAAGASTSGSKKQN